MATISSSSNSVQFVPVVDTNTVGYHLGIKPPKVFNHNKAAPLTCADPQLIHGVELEIENVPNWDELLFQGLTSVDDGSLRNNGREFITQPMSYSVLVFILEKFFEKAKFTHENYSERTSVHVHCNCTDLTVDELQAVCLLYQVFEPLLYAFIGYERDKNIFCIPWNQTVLSYNLIKTIETKQLATLKGWQKYTGLNLLPLLTQGTIEFRHMAGTNDMVRIKAWLNLIGSLFAYARNNPVKTIKDVLINLNSTSEYVAVTERVFTAWAHHLMTIPGHRILLEDGVLNMKYSLIKGKDKTIEETVQEFTAAGFPLPRHTGQMAPGLGAIANQEQDLMRGARNVPPLQGDVVIPPRAVNPFRATIQPFQDNLWREVGNQLNEDQ